MDTKIKVSFTVTSEGKQLLEKLAAQYGMSQSAMFELIIREKARQEGLWDTDRPSQKAR